MIVVTRHAALVELLRERGIIGDDARVIAHATPNDVRGQHVIGVLPLSLAAIAASVTEVSLNLSPEDRGKELPIERLREIAGPARSYKILAGSIEESPIDGSIGFYVSEFQDGPIWATFEEPDGEIAGDFCRYTRRVL